MKQQPAQSSQNQERDSMTQRRSCFNLTTNPRRHQRVGTRLCACRIHPTSPNELHYNQVRHHNRARRSQGLRGALDGRVGKLGHIHLGECIGERRGTRLHGPRQRARRVAPLESGSANLALLIRRGLTIILHKLEAAIRSSVHLHLERTTGQRSRVLHHGGQRHNGAGPHEHRDLTHLSSARDVLGSLLHPTGVEAVPLTLRQIHVLGGILVQHRGHHQITIEPLVGQHRSGGILRVLRHQRPHPQTVGLVHSVGQGIVVRQQLVAKIQRGLQVHAGIAPQPREMGSGILGGVHTHRRDEGTNLVPTCEQVCARFAGEPSNVARHVRRASQTPVEHHPRRVHQVIPAGVDVAGPHRGAQTGHTWTPCSVDAVEAGVIRGGPQRLKLSHIPPVESVKVGLSFIIPEEAHAIRVVVLLLLRVPVPSSLDAVVQVAALSIPKLSLPPWQNEALGCGELDQVRVAEPRLADTSHTEVQLLPVLLQLRLGLREGQVAEVEVVVIILALGRIGVVGLSCKPTEIGDKSINRVVAIPELMQHGLDVGTILPSPPGSDESKPVSRRHSRGPDQRVISRGTLIQCGRWHQIQLKSTLR
mmetsp:Transcript_24040/g.54766  ORF Transcript_24040/g.54766 Transcript_24040/m.54766 type:complete len:589 (+) Transcript_24040:153-1919(+)